MRATNGVKIKQLNSFKYMRNILIDCGKYESELRRHIFTANDVSPNLKKNIYILKNRRSSSVTKNILNIWQTMMENILIDEEQM